MGDLIRIVYRQPGKMCEEVPDRYVKVPETLVSIMGSLQDKNYYGSLELKYENGKITHGKKTESLKF